MSRPKQRANRAQGDTAFAEMEASLEKAGRIEDLIRLYEARSKELSAPQEAAVLLVRAGEVARDRLKNHSRAEELFRRALTAAPKAKEALQGLRILCEQKQDHPALAEVLERMAAASSGPEAAALYLKAADLHEQKLGRKERAAVCAQLASRAEPRERAAYQRVRQLFLSENRLRPALECLERERAALGGDGLADEYAAIAERLAEDPFEHATALAALDTLKQIEPKHKRLGKVQTAIEKHEHGWRERVRSLRAASLEERDRKSAARLSLLVAKLHAFYDGTGSAKVKDALDRCFLLWPAMPDALCFIEGRAAQLGDAAGAVAQLEKLATDAKDRGAQVELWMRAGILKLTKLQDSDGALASFERAAAADSTRPDACSLAAELCIEKGRIADAIAVLERHLSTLKDRPGQVSLHLRLAELCRLEAKDPDRARRHLEAALEIEPSNAYAAFGWAKLVAEAGEVEAVWPLLELATTAPAPLSERVALCERLAAGLEERGQLPQAFQALALALQLEPTRPLLLGTVVEAAQKAGAFEQLAVALHRAAQVAPPKAAALIYRNLASVLQNPLSRPAEAEAAWQEVLRLSPGDAAAQEALTALERTAAVDEGTDAQAAQLEAQAKKLEGTAADPAAAKKVYQRMLELRPDDVAALRHLGAACAALAQWDEVAQVAEKLLQLSESPSDRQEWRSRLAQLYAERLGRKEEAARLYLGLLEERITTAAVVGGLERLASQGVRQAEISKALAPHYAKSGDYQRQVASLLVQLSTVQGAEEQKGLLSLLAETSEKHLMDSRAAFDFRLRGLAADPSDPTFRSEAVRLSRVLSAGIELSRSLVDLGGKVGDPALATSLLVGASELAEEAAAVDDAAAALLAALKKSPDDPEILGRLVSLYRRAGRHADCDQALRRRILVADPAEKASLYLALSEVSADLGRPREAAQAVQEAIRAGADEKTNLPRLCQLLEAGGRTSELSSALGRMIELAEAEGDRERASNLSLKRAQLLEASLGDRAEAVKRYSEVLQARPSDPDALAALEHLLADPSCREEAARALVPAYETVKDHRKLVAALAVIADAAQDSLEKVLALKQAAYIHTHHLRQPEQAFAALAQALRLSPGDASVRAATRQAAEEADAVDSYAEVVSELLEGQAGPVAQALRRELAEVYERKLNDRKSAVAQLARVLELEPKNSEALRALQRLHRADEQWPELAAVVERLAQVEPEPAEKIALWREAAVLHEQKLGDKERAAAAFRQIAARDVLDREAAAALDRLYGELDRPEELAFALELRRNQEGQSPKGRELAFRLAQLRKSRLEDGPGALQLLRQILDEDPSHGGAREALEAWAGSEQPESGAAMEILDPVLAHSSEHQRRIALREARMATGSPSERARLGAEIRAIYERDLGQSQSAFMSALRAFSEGLDREGIRPDLERLARETGSFEELAEIYETAAGECLPGDEQAVALLRRAAELREQLGQTEEAIRAWKSLLGEAPQDRQALENLGKLYERSQNARQLSEVYAKQAQLASEPAERRELLMKAGQAYEAAGEDALAIEVFKSVLAIKKGADALTALDRLFGKARRFTEQADVLDQLAEMRPDEAGRKGYLLRRGQLLEREMQVPEAINTYRAVLELSVGEPVAVGGLERLLGTDQGRPEAARLLEPIYRKQNDFKRLVEVLDMRLALAEPSLRGALLNEIAIIREMLGQKALAFAARLRAFAEDPENTEVQEELERLAADTGSFEELAAAYEDQLERGVSERTAGELWRRLAVIYGDRLSRPELAARAFGEVHRRDPQNLPVLDNLARIFRKANAFKELALVMRKQIALEPKVREQTNLLFELANLAEEVLSDKALAAECYQAILERKPDDANAVKFLGRVLSEAERYPELAQLISREAELAEARGATEEAMDLLVRLGRLKLTRLSDGRGALDTFAAILKRRPAQPGAVGALEEMARSESPLRGEAATMLEPVFSSVGEHLKLVQMLESRASTEPVPQNRAALLRKVADLYAQQMDNPEMAFVAATRALREVPDDERSLELCLFLVDAADAADELSALLSEVASKASDDKARASLFRALARLQVDHQEHAEAVESWKRVLEVVPSDAEALDSIGRLLGKQGKVSELLEVLRRQLSLCEEPSRRAALLFQIGSLQHEQVKDAPGALATFRRLIELKPDDPAALERMDQLCEQLERWPELADVLAKRLALQGTQGDPALKLRLGLLRESKLLDKFGGIELYTELLAADPRHSGALGRMEAIAAREPQNGPACEVLMRAYRQNGELPKLAALIESRVSVSADPFERKALLLELGGLRESQEEAEMAYLAFYRAFKEDPNDAELRKKLENAADAAKTYDELAGAYEEELPRIAEAQDAAEVCLKLGFVLDQKLAEPSKAAAFYEKAHQLDSGVYGRALPALDRLYNQLDRPAELARVLEALAALGTDPREQVGFLFRLGQLCAERLDSPDRAAEAYQKLLELDPKHLPSMRLLEGLYEAAKKSDKLYAVLKAQRDLVSGPERERILSRMAVVSAEGLSDVSHSIEIYRELLQKNPRNEQAFAAMDGLLEKGGRFDELRELLLGKLAHTIDPRELVRLNDRLGGVLFRMLERPEEAIPHFKAALERDARHRDALESLKEIYEQLSRQDDLVIVLRRLIPLQESAEGVKALRIRLAEVLSEMGRREEALDAGRRSLEVEPHSQPEMNRVFAVFVKLRAFGDAVRSLELRSQAELAQEDREAAVATMFEVADLWRGPAGKTEAAGGALEKILELDPANRKAYEQAVELYAKHNDWRAYAQVMDRYLPHLVTEEEKLAALRELGRVQESRLGQKDVAFLQYCRALQLNPSDDEVRSEVERLADETGSYEELAAVYEEVADALPRGPLAERMYLVLARVQDQKLDDAPEAEAALRRILEFDPTNEAALDALAAMFARRGRDREYVVALEQKLEAAGSIERRKDILREIARVYDEKLSNPQESASALLRALELEPDPRTLEVLTSLYRRQNEWANVAGTLLRARDLAPTPEQRSQIQAEVALLYEREVEDDEAAIEAYRQALEFDPTNRAALDALERLYTKLDRPAELLQVYERQLELSPDYRERVKVLFKSAAIWEERYENLANADACIDGVLTIDPQNLQAIKALERLRKTQGRWDELIGVVDRHIQLLHDPTEQAGLCVEMGDIFHNELKQVDRAVTAYHQALELDQRCRPAMHALGTLYERSGNWPFALDMLQREARVAGPTSEAVELYHRMGKINEDMLLDPGSAKGCYLEALKIDPGYLPCIRALKGIHEIEKDWGSYEKALVQEAQQTEEPEAKARALLEVARYCAERKEDRDGATQWYEEALKLAPDLLEAARPLADIYIAKENWEGAERMLDVVALKMAQQAVQQQDEQVAKELCRQLYRLGYVGEKRSKKDKALKSYEKAYQLDATYLPALEGLGNLLVQAKRFDEALKVYQTILLHHRDDLTDLEVVEIYWQLGDVHVQLKQPDRAQNHFEKALGIDPGHEPSLRALVSLSDLAGKFDKSAEYRQSLLQILDGDAKFQVCLDLGKLAKEKLSDAYMAIDAYVAAHKLKPDSLEVMDALYVLYRESKQGQKAAEVLRKMLEQPALRKEPQKAKRVFFALGEISRDELKDLEAAAAAFNAALDTDYRFIEAFSAIEAMLVRAKKWKALEANYTRMLQRLPKVEDTNAARLTLWRALGDLYLRVLKQPQDALMAYQVVAAGLPEDSPVQEKFAELAAAAGQDEKAVEAYRRALPQTTNPGKVASALAELAARRKDYDSAYLAAQVVSGLIGDAGPGEREILTKLTPYARKKEVAQRPLTERLWETHLFHPKIRGPISQLMAILFEQAGHLYKEEYAKYQINPKRHLIDVGGAQEYQIHHFRYVARLLGMEAVALFSPFLLATRERMAKRSNEPAPDPLLGVEICHTHPLSLKVGGKFFGETGQKEVYYLLGRTMALLRPELALSHWLSAERLEAVFQAAISLSVEKFRFTADPRAIDTERKALERILPERARDPLARVTREYVRSATSNDLRNYLEGAELSAVRTGLFVAGEIEPVKKMVLGESGASHRVQVRSKIRDLMVFALSEDLHALRVAVGTQVEVHQRKG
ncbi:MAG: tetratricopeptide repeat protein [Myxococcales bacterium]|nr:tetratricopeptide repeat protein [Myxococcales bacterium]